MFVIIYFGTFCPILNVHGCNMIEQQFGHLKQYWSFLIRFSRTKLHFENLFNIIKTFIRIFNEIKRLGNKNFTNNLKIKKNKIIKKNEIYPLNLIKLGEPHLSKYKIHYKTINVHSGADKLTLALKWLIHYSDGKNSLQDISVLSKISLKTLTKVFKNLMKAKIFSKIN